MKFSIIIPTWGAHSRELLERLCPTIAVHTDFSNTECIIVANGCTDTTREYVESLGYNWKLVWFDEALGYARAINEGAKVAQGEFIVPLNNDTMIQGSDWLDILYAPFHNPKVAVTGPMKTWSPETERLFLIFFVVMIRKSVFDQLGGLDETFGSWGEDTHFCHQVEDKLSMKIVQVPIDAHSTEELTRSEENPNIGIGYFPIWHEGGRSIQELGRLKGDELINRNSNLLKERYNPHNMIHIKKALKIDGWLTELELDWLGKQIKQLNKKDKSYIAEIGSWKGRSSRVLADNMPKNCVLFCIDTWSGSINEQDTHHVEAKKMDGDFVYDYFCRNLWDLIEAGKVIPLRMHAEHAANFIKDLQIQLDFCFIDGDHSKGATKANILSFLPLLNAEATICGHDYMTYEYPDVAIEVLDIWYTNVGHPQSTSIWYSTPGSIPNEKRAYVIQEMKPPAIYDCFTFFNELDVLEIRLQELYDVVDRFIIVEAEATHQREPKPLYFKENLNRFQKFLHKISHMIVGFPDHLSAYEGNNLPAGEAYWALERFQRDKIMEILKLSARRNDTIVISDIDEIPNAEVVRNYKSQDGIRALEQDFYYYNFNCKSDDTWKEGKILTYGMLEQVGGPCQARYHQCPKIPNAGWHLSYFGNTDHVIKKIKSFAHREYNTEDVIAQVEERIKQGKDLFGRPDQPFKLVDLQDNLPSCIYNNLDHYKQIGFIIK